jgi:DNA-binding CsgD family transcriptional regulator
MNQVLISDIDFEPEFLLAYAGAQPLAPDAADAPDAAGEIEVTRIWPALVAGSLVIRHTWHCDQRSVMIVERLRVPRPRLPQTCARVLESILLGEAQKIASSDYNISASAVAELAKHGLRAIGLTCQPSRMPVTLFMLVAAFRGGVPLRGVTVKSLDHRGRSFVLVIAPGIGELVTIPLSKALRAVTELLIAGRSYAEIAQARGCSQRTVANQLATMFRRFEISGRGELLALLARSRRELPIGLPIPEHRSPGSGRPLQTYPMLMMAARAEP